MDTPGIEILWNQLHVRLCRFICSRLADEDDAEDILQEVFLRIHANLAYVRDMKKLESWVYQIARNSITDYYRSKRTHVELSDYPVEDEDDSLDIPVSLSPYLREVVESLPEPYREALILTEYQGVSQKELSDRLGISFSGAKSRVQRARQKVRDIMLTCCHFEFDARGLVCCYSEKCCCCEEMTQAGKG